VQLIFWPPHATSTIHNGTAQSTGDTDNAATYVDDDNFTWTSPSVYIIFNGLSATDRCGLVGSSIGRTTMSFDPQDVSSILTRRVSHLCNYTEMVGPGTTLTTNIWASTALEPLTSQLLTYSDVAQNCSSIEGYTWYDGMPEEYYYVVKGRAGGKFPCREVLFEAGLSKRRCTFC
jgi:hypothetical protein